MQQKGKLKLGIYGITSMLYMQVVVSVLLGNIAEVFPDASLYQIQLVFSITSITVLVGSLLAGKLADYVSKKTLTQASLVMLVLSGAAPIVFHSNINQFIISSGFVGLAVGLLQTFCDSMSIQLFEGTERDRVIGVKQTVLAVAGTVFIYIAGLIAATNYLNGFYVYFAAVLVMVLVAVCLPKDKPEKEIRQEAHDEKVNPFTGGLIKILVMMLLFAGFQGAFMENISLIVINSDIGDASVSGTAISLYIAGGILVGFTMGPILKLKKYVLPFCFLLSGIGLILPLISLTTISVYLCGIIVGYSCTLFYGVCLDELPGVVKPNAVTMGAALISAVFGLGSFISPYLINPFAAAFTSGTDSERLLVAAIATFVCGILSIVLFALPKKDKTE